MSQIFIPDARDFPAITDLLIVGGGVIGAATAFYAARAGLQTLVVEKRAALGELTTSASLAAFRAQFAEPENIALMKESIEVFENFCALTGVDIGIRQQGYLFVTTAPDGWEKSRARVEQQKSFGLEDIELLTGDEARARFSFLASAVTAATFRQRDGWLAAHELTYGYARASGARVFLETPVTAWRIEAGRVTGAVTPRGEIRAAHSVIAAGPFSGILAHRAGVVLPLANVRRQQVTLRAHPRIPRDAPMVVDADTGAHWRPEGAGAVLAWSRPEPPGEPLEYVPTDWDFPARVLDGVARVAPFWNEITPRLARADLARVAGQYTEAPDANPLIGATAVEGLWLNTAYGGHGVMMSAAGARLFVDVLLGKRVENPFPVNRDFAHGERMVL